MREASIVRRILFHNWVEAFAREEPQFAGETRKVAENIIHQAVDDVISDSAEQFVEEQLKATSNLNSQLGDALADVRHEKGAANAANTAKDRFLAMLSHELRTPLNPILLWANAKLAETQTAPSLKEDIQMVRHNVELEASLHFKYFRQKVRFNSLPAVCDLKRYLFFALIKGPNGNCSAFGRELLSIF